MILECALNSVQFRFDDSMSSQSQKSPIGETTKRILLTSAAMILALCAIVALLEKELVWFGVCAAPAALLFWIAVWGRSEAVKKAADLVEHSAFTLHVPGQAKSEKPNQARSDPAPGKNASNARPEQSKE